MSKTWDAARVATAMNALKDNGVTVRQMISMTGAHRSTVYRWLGGGEGGQPDYDLVYALARGVFSRYPELARELVEASGYAWADPPAEPEPVPELDDDPELLETWRRLYRDDPGKVRDAARALLEREASGQAAGDGPAPRRRAG